MKNWPVLIIYFLYSNVMSNRLRSIQCTNYGCECVNNNFAFGIESTCPNEVHRHCYAKFSTCKKQSDGLCGFTENDNLKNCLNKPCEVRGCFGEFCEPVTEPPQLSLCSGKDKKPWLKCYEIAECKIQSNGKCGFTPKCDLFACLFQNKKFAI